MSTDLTLSATSAPAIDAAALADGARLERRATRATLLLGVLLLGAMAPVAMLVAPLKELVGERYGASPFWVHSFMSVNMVGAIAAAPVIAALSDRRHARAGRRWVAAGALTLDALLLASMAYMPTLPAILVARFLEGAAHILALSTLMAMAAGWARSGRRGRMMGVVGASMMFGTAIGTRLGGVVWQHWPGWVFHVAGLISLLTAVCVACFVTELPERDMSRSRLRDVFSLLARQKNLLVPFAYAFIDRFCVGVVISTFVLFLGDVHGLDPARRSGLLLLFLIPFALLTYPAGRLVDRIGRIWPLALGSVVFGLVFASYGLWSVGGLYVVMLVSGVTSAAMFAPNLTLCADLAPPGQRGAVYTGFNVFGSLGFVLGPVCAGLLYSVLAARWSATAAYQVTFVLTGSTEVLCAAVTLPALLRLRRAGLTR